MASPLSAVRLRIDAYPEVLRIPTRFSDMDLFGHVNNASLAQMYDDAVARFNSEVFGRDLLTEPGRRQLLLAESVVRYLAAAYWPQDMVTGIGVTKVGRSSFGLGLGCFQNETCITASDIAMVYAEDGVARPIPEGARSKLQSLLIEADQVV